MKYWFYLKDISVPNNEMFYFFETKFQSEEQYEEFELYIDTSDEFIDFLDQFEVDGALDACGGGDSNNICIGYVAYEIPSNKFPKMIQEFKDHFENLGYDCGNISISNSGPF